MPSYWQCFKEAVGMLAIKISVGIFGFTILFSQIASKESLFFLTVLYLVLLVPIGLITMLCAFLRRHEYLKKWRMSQGRW